MDLNLLAGGITLIVIAVGIAGIVACIVLLIRLIPSPVPGACQCCGAAIPADGAAYCGECWGVLVAAQEAGRSLAVIQANRRALVAGRAPREIRAAMLVALGHTQ